MLNPIDWANLPEKILEAIEAAKAEHGWDNVGIRIQEDVPSITSQTCGLMGMTQERRFPGSALSLRTTSSSYAKTPPAILAIMWPSLRGISQATERTRENSF